MTDYSFERLIKRYTFEDLIKRTKSAVKDDKYVSIIFFLRLAFDIDKIPEETRSIWEDKWIKQNVEYFEIGIRLEDAENLKSILDKSPYKVETVHVVHTSSDSSTYNLKYERGPDGLFF